jgi:hypothetical protein
MTCTVQRPNDPYWQKTVDSRNEIKIHEVFRCKWMGNFPDLIFFVSITHKQKCFDETRNYDEIFHITSCKRHDPHWHKYCWFKNLNLHRWTAAVPVWMNRVADLFMANLLFVSRESNGSDELTAKDCTWFQSVTTASLSLGCSFNALQLHPSFCDHSMYYNNSNWAVRTIQYALQQPHLMFFEHSIHRNNSIHALVIIQFTAITPCELLW